MGLDVTFYQGLKPLNAVRGEDGEPVDEFTKTPSDLDGVFLMYNPHYQRHDGLFLDRLYSYEDEDGLSHSYSGYGHWREQLARFAGWPLHSEEGCHAGSAWHAESGPFWELICFSDCEGTIGPVTSAKIAKDFAAYQRKANLHEDESFRERYALWREGFELAANGGAVVFH